VKSVRELLRKHVLAPPPVAIQVKPTQPPKALQEAQQSSADAVVTVSISPPVLSYPGTKLQTATGQLVLWDFLGHFGLCPLHSPLVHVRTAEPALRLL